MKAEIDFQSTNRFFMSMGFALCMIANIPAFLLLYSSDSIVQLILFVVLFILFLSIGLKLLLKGYNGMKQFEALEEKSKFEYLVNQILDQDLKFIDIRIKLFEYNEKVKLLKEMDKSTYLGINPLKEIQHRDIQLIVEQALDPNFYKNTYPDIITKITEKKKR